MSLAPILPLHKIVPAWTLPNLVGDGSLNLAKQRGRAHALLVVAHAGVALDLYLATLAPMLAALRSLPAQGILVWTSTADSSPLTPPPAPWQAVRDETGRVAARYLPASAQIGVFVLDRYNDLYHQWLVATPADLPSPPEVTEWLEAVSNQCSI